MPDVYLLGFFRLDKNSRLVLSRDEELEGARRRDRGRAGGWRESTRGH